MESYVKTCRSPLGWNGEIEEFRMTLFGMASGDRRGETAWICAQRRPGRALAWLQSMYRNEEDIPDVLMLVDDDTAVVRHSSLVIGLSLGTPF